MPGWGTTTPLAAKEPPWFFMALGGAEVTSCAGLASPFFSVACRCDRQVAEGAGHARSVGLSLQVHRHGGVSALASSGCAVHSPTVVAFPARRRAGIEAESGSAREAATRAVKAIGAAGADWRASSIDDGCRGYTVVAAPVSAAGCGCSLCSLRTVNATSCLYACICVKVWCQGLRPQDRVAWSGNSVLQLKRSLVH
jgi:hypothetical protein